MNTVQPIITISTIFHLYFCPLTYSSIVIIFWDRCTYVSCPGHMRAGWKAWVGHHTGERPKAMGEGRKWKEHIERAGELWEHWPSSQCAYLTQKTYRSTFLYFCKFSEFSQKQVLEKESSQDLPAPPGPAPCPYPHPAWESCRDADKREQVWGKFGKGSIEDLSAREDYTMVIKKSRTDSEKCIFKFQLWRSYFCKILGIIIQCL